MIKIWIDDERPMPEGYDFWCKTVYDTIYRFGRCWLNRYLPGGSPEVLLDLDYDASDEYRERFGGDYIKILIWLENWLNASQEQDWLNASQKMGDPVIIKVHFHSANPVGVKNMRAIVEHCPWMEEV